MNPRACNEYDVNMEESLESNSMFDAVRQFQIVSDLLVFENIPFIVFFNKYDLLPDKVKRSPLSGVCDPGTSYSSAVRHSKIITTGVGPIPSRATKMTRKTPSTTSQVILDERLLLASLPQLLVSFLFFLFFGAFAQSFGAFAQSTWRKFGSVKRLPNIYHVTRLVIFHLH